MKEVFHKKRIKVSPCSHCGYTAVRRTDRVDLGEYGYLIQCPRCRSKGRIGETVDEAVEKWNAENSAGKETEESA